MKVEVSYRIERDREVLIRTNAPTQTIMILREKLEDAESIIAEKESCSTEDIFDWWTDGIV